jgi:hypothetical protein
MAAAVERGARIVEIHASSAVANRFESLSRRISRR